MQLSRIAACFDNVLFGVGNLCALLSRDIWTQFLETGVYAQKET